MADGVLSGRTALVTGASSGIGEATALALAKAGAKVALAARRRDRLETLAEQVRAAGGEALVLEVDYGDERAAAESVRSVEQAWGRLDILINNAGVMYLEPVAEDALERWRKMLEVNVLGLIAATAAALPGMRERKTGHIVNISSTAGRIGNPNGAGYSATKFGVVGFSEGLRKEVHQDNIRVTTIEPGVVETELREHVAHPQAQQGIKAYAESMRQLRSTDIADLILFVVSRPDHVNINEVLIRPTDQDR
jgi:NADP-dependent 3-hydroxy acid dehydrogenase YdfG